MSEPQRHQCAISDFAEGGDLHIKTPEGIYFIFSLGPAQIISIKRGVDRFVATYEAGEHANKENVAS